GGPSRGEPLSDLVWTEVDQALARLEQIAAARLGDPARPLLLSVRPTDQGDWPLAGVANGTVGFTDAPAGRPFPRDAREQLRRAIEAAAHWTPREAPRRVPAHEWPDRTSPVACVVQVAVFGDRDDRSGAGVVSTRDPATGERRLAGEWLPQAREYDLGRVAAGAMPISAIPGSRDRADSLEQRLPACHEALERLALVLERHARDARELAFVIEAGALHLVGARLAVRSPAAAVKIAVDLAKEGVLSREDAILRVDADALDPLLHATVDAAAPRTLLARGLGASPGGACGHLVFAAGDALRQARRGVPVILIRMDTAPEDIPAIRGARGVVTVRGGVTSHTAVVARAMGRPCVAAASAISVDSSLQSMTVTSQDESGRRTGAVSVARGALVTLDGASGAIYAGEVPLVRASLSGELGELLGWADAVRRLRVRANADTPAEIHAARAFGAEGIGLLRTEHMFFEERRLEAVRRVILADGPEARAQALEALLPLHREDFAAVFRESGGWPVTIRLLDPPLHEFLPRERAAVERVADGLRVSARLVERRVEELTEENPMLGHRGCRLAVTHPEIYATQTRAILEAALLVGDEGAGLRLELLVPFVASAAELERAHEVVERAAEAVFEREGRRVPFAFGTMIELPRAALLAGELARHAAFFSFGTNDLTQATFGLSRDDAGALMRAYLESGLFDRNPFASIDEAGVGALVALAVERGRRARASLSAGVCGEHGGDPRSIAFFERAGLDHVSCSPFRVPAARLAAAQAALQKA
ncbi:MAG: pyruvate, phosphate dikinase, partial [Myxococcales bacterium]|nr:pyruvate, phosphate dikinase [Myxococcales bacterium]